MNRTGVRVTAEWALRGKLESDRGYRLLSWSNGVLGAQNFEELLTRYSPGTLEGLPQATLSWISSSEAGRSYLAIAIHDLSEVGTFDRDGRKIVFTKYFCVPYEQLTGAAVSYLGLYDKFSAVQLPLGGGSPLPAELTEGSPEVPPNWTLAARVVGLLLSGSPVCIIDADRAEMLARLRFVDGVMALLPYGLRSRMSASTWTSSTTQRHKFRLFFSNAPRVPRDPDERDHVVSWMGILDHEQRGTYAPGHSRLADQYVRWLESWGQPPLTSMANLTEQLSFSRRDIERMLDTVRKLPRRHGLRALPAAGQTTPDHAPPHGSAEVPAPQELVSGEPVRSDSVPTADRPDLVVDLLNSCASLLAAPDQPGVEETIAALDNQLRDPEVQRTERRRQYWDIIISHGLLRPHLVDFESQLCETLLRVAFGRRPISYEVYCQIEDSLGSPPHMALADAINRIEVSGIHTEVIVHRGLTANTLMGKFHARKRDLRELIYAAATEELKSEHLRAVCEFIVRALNDPAMRPQLPDIRVTLRHHGYLAPVLQRRELDDHEYQVKILSGLLLGALGGKLDRVTAAEVLSDADENMPTPGLLAAVALQLLDPADASFALREFAIAYATYAGFDSFTRDELMDRFARDDRPLPATQVMEAPSHRSKPPTVAGELPLGSYIEAERTKAGKKQRRLPWHPRVHRQNDSSESGPEQTH